MQLLLSLIAHGTENGTVLGTENGTVLFFDMIREKKVIKEEMGKRMIYGSEGFTEKIKMEYDIEDVIGPKGRPKKEENDNK